MKKILIIASLALCCSLLASCEDFLDTKKYGAKTDWETQEDVEKALVALFSFKTFVQSQTQNNKIRMFCNCHCLRDTVILSCQFFYLI